MTLEEKWKYLGNLSLIIDTCFECGTTTRRYITIDVEYIHPARELCVECYERLGK